MMQEVIRNMNSNDLSKKIKVTIRMTKLRMTVTGLIGMIMTMKLTQLFLHCHKAPFKSQRYLSMSLRNCWASVTEATENRLPSPEQSVYSGKGLKGSTPGHAECN